jgi:hypothetical protein
VTAALVSVGFDLARWEAQEQIWRAPPPSQEGPPWRPTFHGRWWLPNPNSDARALGSGAKGIKQRAFYLTSGDPRHCRRGGFGGLNMGHNMMLEPGWHAAAERIVGWLADQGL